MFSRDWKRDTFSAMKNPANKTTTATLRDAYKVPGFRVCAKIDSYELEPPVFVLTLDRRSKKQCAADAPSRSAVFTTNAGDEFAILDAGIERFISTSKCAA